MASFFQTISNSLSVRPFFIKLFKSPSSMAKVFYSNYYNIYLTVIFPVQNKIKLRN